MFKGVGSGREPASNIEISGKEKTMEGLAQNTALIKPGPICLRWVQKGSEPNELRGSEFI